MGHIVMQGILCLQMTLGALSGWLGNDAAGPQGLPLPGRGAVGLSSAPYLKHGLSPESEWPAVLHGSQISGCWVLACSDNSSRQLASKAAASHQEPVCSSYNSVTFSCVALSEAERKGLRVLG